VITKKDRFFRRTNQKAVSIVWFGKILTFASTGWFYNMPNGHTMLKTDAAVTPWHKKVCGFWINSKVVTIFVQWRYFYRPRG
jgi:hypothetical protein